MSSCLEKVIKKLTAYKEGALSAEMRPTSSPDGEEPHPSRKHHASPKGISCEDRGVTQTCSSVKREPFYPEEGDPTLEEQRAGDNFPLDFIRYRAVHIKEEPRRDNMEAPPYYSHLKEEDGRLAHSSCFSALPAPYPQYPFFSRSVHFLSQHPFYCSECGRGFSHRSYFLSHQRVHHHPKYLRGHQAENPFTCSLCHKSFIHRGHFLAHQRLHAEEEKFSCPLCGKSFIHHGHFLAHQRSHTEESRFSCPHCHKSFIHRGHFSAHLRVHTGEKPFACPDCGSSFSTHHNLVVHQRLHASSFL